METIVRARKTDLARNTRRIIQAVQRGQTVIIEHHGQPEVAILDIGDYRILRALAYNFTNKPQVQRGSGLSHELVAAESTEQAQFNLVLAYYLADEISLARTAEILGLTWLDLRSRFIRLDVPLRAAPSSQSEARDDIESAAAWFEKEHT